MGVGQIYRAVKPVLWSPSSRSALAEAEISYKDDHTSESVFVIFPLAESSPGLRKLRKAAGSAISDAQPISLIVWTTTPWTLPANQASFNAWSIWANTADSLSVRGLRSRYRLCLGAKRVSALHHCSGQARVYERRDGPDPYGLGNPQRFVRKIVDKWHAECSRTMIRLGSLRTGKVSSAISVVAIRKFRISSNSSCRLRYFRLWYWSGAQCARSRHGRLPGISRHASRRRRNTVSSLFTCERRRPVPESSGYSYR